MPRSSLQTIAVSEGQRATLDAHLERAREMRMEGSRAEDELAWIHKCASLLYLLSPAVGQGNRGLVSSFFTDLRLAIDRFRPMDRSDGNYQWMVSEQFAVTVSNLEALTECITVAPDSIVVENDDSPFVNPYFFDIPNASDDQLVFVLMPFTEPWSDRIWNSHVKPIVERIALEPPLKCKRADDLYGHDVMRDIVTAIRSSRLLIADITDRNPNVFYELGIAHWMGKRVILITQTVDDIPFDLLRFRHIIYQDNSDGCETLNRELEAAILESLAK